MKQCVFQLLSPMQVSSLSFLVLLRQVDLQKLHESPLFVLSDLVLVLRVCYHLSFYCEVTHFAQYIYSSIDY